MATLAGCGGAPEPPVVDLTIRAAPDLNRNAAGTPLAVAVRLYTLNARSRFSTADAYTLMDRDRTVLADEGSRVEEIVVRPGETRKINLMPKPDARYIGAVVLFRDIDRSQWRAVAAIAPSGLTKLVLTMGSNRATLEAA
jgi:type VI secretion system protein VasD